MMETIESKCPYIQNEMRKKSSYFANFPIEECYCDKVGGRIKYSGTCYQDFQTQSKDGKGNPPKRNKRERDLKYRKRLKRIEAISRFWYPSAVLGVDANREWAESSEDIVYYKRNYRANHAPGRSGYYKRYANRRVRRYCGEISDGNGYRKIFDYWWELT